MITLRRPAVCIACAFALARAAVGQTTVPRQPAPSRAELEALLASQPTWSFEAAIFSAFGYKDNLLLSFAEEERSPFVRGGVDFLLMRLPEDRFDFSVFAEAEGTRFTQGETVDQNAKVWIRTEPAYRLTDTLRIALPITGYYYDQVFDVSDTEVERLVAELKVRGVMIGPAVRWDVSDSWWFEAQAAVQRKRYEDESNDGDLGEGAVRLGWHPRAWLEVSVSGGQRWRDYASRAQYSSSGRELTGTELKIAEREAELRWDVTWDEEARWETSTRLSLLHYRDNGSGYFNFREQRVAHEVEWNAEPWKLRVGGSAARLDFGVQKVGLGINPPARLRDEFSAELLLERKVARRWKVFSAYTWERCRSNDFIASYTVNEGLLGLRWTWER